MSPAAPPAVGETAHSYQVRSVDRALDLLAEFEDAHTELSLLELTARSGLAKPTVYRLLTTLRQRCYLQQCPESRSYRLGPAYLERVAEVTMLSHRGSTGFAANDRCARRLRRFADATLTTAGLSIRVGGRRVLVAQAIPSEADAVDASPMVGDSTDLMADPAGHLLLAAMGVPGSSEYLRRHERSARFSPAWGGLGGFMERLDRISEQGWCEGRLGGGSGACMVAAPVLDHGRRVLAVVHAQEACAAVGLGAGLRAAVVREARSLSLDVWERVLGEDPLGEA